MREYNRPVINVTKFDEENIVTGSDIVGRYNFNNAGITYTGKTTTWNNVSKSQEIENTLGFSSN